MNQEKEWREEFDEKFVNGARLGGAYAVEMGKEIKSFISALLLSQRQEMIKEIKERGELVYLPEDEKPTWHITDEALKEVFGECPMKGRMCQCGSDEECIHLNK